MHPLSRWRLAELLGGAIAVVAIYVLAGMPGIDRGTSTGSHATRPLTNELAELTPQQFDQALHGRDVVVINVHVSYDGEIEGTDVHIPYDEIAGSGDLPADLGQPILLYCRSGRMSQIAGATLIDVGYTDVAHLAGGMEAWAASGSALLDAPWRS